MAGWIPVLIIIFAVALVVGPVMWLKPSEHDRRLAALRQNAAAAGMTVQMKALPAALGQGTAAVYFRRWGDQRRLRVGWTLELQRLEHEMHFSGRWDWRNGREAPQAAWEPLRQLVSQLPGDACAVVASESALGVQWQESSGQKGLVALQSALNEFGPIIEAAIRQPRPRSAGEER